MRLGGTTSHPPFLRVTGVSRCHSVDTPNTRTLETVTTLSWTKDLGPLGLSPFEEGGLDFDGGTGVWTREPVPGSPRRYRGCGVSFPRTGRKHGGVDLQDRLGGGGDAIDSQGYTCPLPYLRREDVQWVSPWEWSFESNRHLPRSRGYLRNQR